MDQLNLKTLARELNLAVSTVSRALRDSHEIKKETKDRVKALAEKMGYQPNFHASSLRQNKSMTIALIVPEIENNFFAQAINGVELVAQKKGYHVLIYLTHDDYAREKSILQLLRSGRVDGVMLSLSGATTAYEHLHAVEEACMPMVLFDRICQEIDVPKVTTDDEQVSFKVTDYLLASGCKKVAFLAMAGQLSISSFRKEGYLRALKAHGIKEPLTVMDCSAVDDDQNRKSIRKILSAKNRPDALFASVEKLAINTYEVCQELNIRIPQDLKLVAFSNLSACGLFNPPLTTIYQPAYEMGKEAAEILFKLIEKKVLLPQEKQVVLPSVIMVRDSDRSR